MKAAKVAMRQHESARILIVDDTESNLALMRRILTRAGYPNVRTTEESRSVMPILTRFAPVLVDTLIAGDLTVELSTEATVTSLLGD